MLKRNTPLKNKTPMARKSIKRGLSSKNAAHVRDKKARRERMRDKRWRSPAYLRWVRSQPCMACGDMGCDAHHVIGLGWQLSGMGLTAPDSYAMSLCRACHSLTHSNVEMQAMQPDWLRHTLRAGIAQFTGEARDQLTHALAFVEAKEQ